MYADGFSISKIAHKTFKTKKEVKDICKQEVLKNEIFSDDKIDRICELYSAGVSAKQLGLKFSIDKRRVQRWAKERGILRNISQSHRVVEFNEKYFDHINTSDKAYWLGFLYADAYNCDMSNTVGITLQGKDKEHLKKLAKAVSLPEEKVIRKTTNAGHDICNLNLYSQYMSNILTKQGCPRAKSFIITYPKWLLPELNRHFIRGLFDGDGCLTFRVIQNEWKWSIVSTKRSCEKIQEILLNTLGISVSIYYISKTNKNTYNLETSGNEKIYAIMSWLYDGSNEEIRLERKYNKFLDLEKQQRSIGLKNKMIKLEPNNNLKTQKKEWTESIFFPGHNFIENDLDNICASDLLIWKGTKLSQKFLRTIGEDHRDEIAKSVFNFLINYDWHKFHYSDADIQRGFKVLQNNKISPDIVDGISYVSNTNSAGHQVYKSFFPNIIKIYEGKRSSIYNALMDREKLWKIIRNRLGNTLLYNPDPKGIPVQFPMNITLSQILIGARNSGIASMGSIFKPAVAKVIYDNWLDDRKHVLDYSCGFGTRLLGLLGTGKDAVYYGYEPNSETYANINNMKEYFGAKAYIKKAGSETNNLFEEKMDFAFSSPPFFNTEIYCDEETQCYIKYPKYDIWLNKYWGQTVRNIKQMLIKDGIFAVNIGGNANPMMKKLEVDLNDMIISNGFRLIDTWYLRTNRSHLSRKKGDKSRQTKLEGIFFYENK